MSTTAADTAAPGPLADAGRLKLLYVSQMVPSPPRFGGQVRIHGLMTALARRHDLSVLALYDPAEGPGDAEPALRAYCRQVVLLPSRPATAGVAKRLLQLGSLASPHSYERHVFEARGLRAALGDLLRRERFDLVNLEFPFLAHLPFRQAPPGAPPPAVVLDEHNIEHDVLRQTARADVGRVRRLYNAVNCRKLHAEELRAWREVDGVTVCSDDDAAQVRAACPGAPLAVIPNAADVERYRPRPTDPPPDGRTVLFFGALGYFPNTDGVLFFLREIWPLLAARHPEARLQLVGPRPPASILAHQGPRVEVTGFVDDLRPYLARAAVVVAPLRIGGGTRLKILEAMAMAKAVVSTAVGASGLSVTPGRHLLLADGPDAFAEAVGGLLARPAEGAALGREARALVEREHSWTAAGDRLEAFLRTVLAARGAAARR